MQTDYLVKTIVKFTSFEIENDSAVYNFLRKYLYFIFFKILNQIAIQTHQFNNQIGSYRRLYICF